MDYVYSVFLLLGGIGLFLYGISFMSQSLERAAGDNLRKILQNLTKTPGKAFAVGAITTAIIQSSGATMTMVAGFVDAQIMGLWQALYAMLGATIGTTITAQIIAFDIAAFAPLILFMGMFLYLFVKNKNCKKIGAVILGFGLLFTGIYIMGDAIDEMNLGSVMQAFLDNFSNPFLMFFFGFLFTFVIQSCSASVGILQVIVAKSVGVAFNYISLSYMVMGMNVGALAPLIITALSLNRRGKRVTAMQVLTRVIAVVVFVVIINLFPAAITMIKDLTPLDPARQIANIHLAYNLLAAIVIFPIIIPLSALGMKFMPDDESEEFGARKLMYFTSSADAQYAVPLLFAQAEKELDRFAKLCIDNFKLAMESFFEQDEKKAEKVIEMEKNINYINHEFNVALVRLYGRRLPSNDVPRVSGMFSVLADFERIADHAENIAEYSASLVEQRARISLKGLEDLERMSAKVIEMLDVTADVYKTQDKALLAKATAIEDEVDDMNDELIENHITRMGQQICDPLGGIIYTDLVSDLERVSDHAMNIAESILGTDAPIED